MTFPQGIEQHGVARAFGSRSKGTESQRGRWASGRSRNGRGAFSHVEDGAAPVPGVIDLARTAGAEAAPAGVAGGWTTRKAATAQE